MKLLRASLMVVVGAIVLLHTLVPHEHFNSATDGLNLYSVSSKADLFEDLQLSFSLDHGNGHFEHYLELDELDDTLFDENRQLTIKSFQVSSVARVVAAPMVDSYYLASDRLRGPPMSA